MSSSFKNLKQDRNSVMKSLSDEFKKLNETKAAREDNDNFWTPTVDKAGNGQAVIRFLPPSEGESKPVIRYWDHGFQGPGGWYIEKSLTSIGMPDPCSELNGKLWNSGNEADKEQVRKQKRKLHFISNIYVVRDPGNPDNEGKVFLFKYGKKIFDKINDMMNPTFEGDDPVNIFDFWEGSNFKLRIRQVDGYRNYDKSEFDKQAPLNDDDGELESIWKSQHKLETFLDPSNFKSYDELKQRLNKVLGMSEQRKSTPPGKNSNNVPWDDEDEVIETKREQTTRQDDEDDDISFFKRLAQS